MDYEVSMLTVPLREGVGELLSATLSGSVLSNHCISLLTLSQPQLYLNITVPVTSDKGNR